MADALGWRLTLGVLAPSTNTSVQPEYDTMRPPGVTNHARGFRIPNERPHAQRRRVRPAA
jgi:maleate isomerase